MNIVYGYDNITNNHVNFSFVYCVSVIPKAIRPSAKAGYQNYILNS